MLATGISRRTDRGPNRFSSRKKIRLSRKRMAVPILVGSAIQVDETIRYFSENGRFGFSLKSAGTNPGVGSGYNVVIDTQAGVVEHYRNWRRRLSDTKQSEN